jgi:hypothetical protein
MTHRSRTQESRHKPQEEEQDHQHLEQVEACTRRAAQLGARAAHLRQQAEWLEAEVQAELHQAGLLIQEAVRRRRREQIRQQEAAVEAHQQAAAAAARRAEAEAVARRVEEDLHLRNKRAQRRRVRFRLPTDR